MTAARPWRVVVAPDSFKESMTAAEAALAIERGLTSALPEARCLRRPISDGGEGLLDVLLPALGGTTVPVLAHDALGRTAETSFGWVPDERLAVIEAARVIGLERIRPEDRDVLHATSRGLGELLDRALRLGARRLVVGLGGTATNDGGAGMLQALGARLLDEAGDELPAGAAPLRRLAAVDLRGIDPRWREVEVRVACDVTNPLLGPDGASAVFGPQKGASRAEVAALEASLTVLARCLATATGRDVGGEAGAGAAGGIAAALTAVLGAGLEPGAELVFATTGLEADVAACDLAVTGEGSLDAQSGRGKAPWALARLARRHGVPVIAFAGRVTAAPDEYAAVVPITQGPCDLATALREGPANLERAARSVAGLLAIDRRSLIE